MGQLLDALCQPATPALASQIEEIHTWTSQEVAAVAILPALAGAVLRRHEGRGDKSLIAGTELISKLESIYAQVFRPHRGRGPVTIGDDQLSRFRYGQLGAGRLPLPALFLIWLTEQIDEQRFPEDSQVFQLLSLFNPVEAVKAFVLRGEPLHRLGPGSPERPFLRSPQSPEIDRAERAVSEGIATLIGLRDFNTAAIYEDLYRGSEQKACFLVYRRAVQAPFITKGFLVVEAPSARSSDAHSFNYWRATSSRDVLAARGFVLTMRSNHVFIGATGSVDPASPPGVRPVLTDGLKCVVIDRDFGVHHKSVWSGLYLSYGPGYVPIAGRCVLVRAGRDRFQDAELEFIRGEGLAADLAKHADRRICRDEAGWETLATAIVQVIDNSYEPPGETVGVPTLAGPLRLVPLPDEAQLGDTLT